LLRHIPDEDLFVLELLPHYIVFGFSLKLIRFDQAALQTKKF
jgi:hypothetical protein